MDGWSIKFSNEIAIRSWGFGLE